MDYARMRLKYHGDASQLHEILQAECREKSEKKLPTLSSHPGFRFPSIALVEMSTSEAVAEVHASLTDGAGERILDMTFGLGVDSFALAAHGCKVTAVELDDRAYECGQHNIASLMPGKIDLYPGDSVKWLEESGESFNTIFIDPQRRDSSGRHFALAQCQPDLTEILPLLRSRSRRVIIKMSPMADVKAVKRELKLDSCRVVIIGTSKECKEVVMIIQAEEPGGSRVDCVTIGHGVFSFLPSADGLPPVYAMPEPDQWLLEPYPAVMKAVPQGSMRHIPFPKLAPQTHLFLSREISADFPGERMKIRAILPFGKQTIREFAKVHPKINVAVRNFPMSAPELAKKLKVKEGGDVIVHGVTLSDGSRVLIVTGMAE